MLHPFPDATAQCQDFTAHRICFKHHCSNELTFLAAKTSLDLAAGHVLVIYSPGFCKWLLHTCRFFECFILLAKRCSHWHYCGRFSNCASSCCFGHLHCHAEAPSAKIEEMGQPFGIVPHLKTLGMLPHKGSQGSTC